MSQRDTLDNEKATYLDTFAETILDRAKGSSIPQARPAFPRPPLGGGGAGTNGGGA